VSEIGPLLETLTRRLAECPAEFLDEPRLGRQGQIVVAAVVNDLLVALGGEPLASSQAAAFNPAEGRAERNRLKVILIACWLLYDDWFRLAGRFAPAALACLIGGLAEAADLTAAGKFVVDPDRREELARRCLSSLNLLPEGETEAQAQDRLTTLNTAERQRVIKAAREAEERARQIREALAQKAAQEAADKAGRE
jgi:hypothetical protein